MKKKIFKMGIIVCMVLGLTACGKNDKEQQEVIDTPKIEEYEVNIEVICNENLFFSRYDVKILVDEKDIGTLEHGGKDKYSIKLPAGTYTFRAEKEEDSNVDGSIEFEVSDNTKLKCELSCKSDQIEIKETKEIPVPLGTNELGKIKYEEVKNLFEEVGFINIEKKVIKDLPEDRLSEEKIVTSISIGDKSTFEKNDKFMSDEKIIIEYHTEKEIEMSVDSSDYENKDYQEVVKEFETLGFENIKTETVDGSSSIDTNNAVCEVTIDGQSFIKGDMFLPDKEVIVKYYVVEESADSNGGSDENVESNETSSELTQYYAKKAFEEYGESQYPFGFKCHWIKDLINIEQAGNTWYFKVGVTITNAYGAEYDTVAEGMVTGTDSAPQMVQFYVSN